MIRGYVMAIPPRANSAALVASALGAVPCIETVTVRFDHVRAGIWGNLSKLLQLVAERDDAALICQDDVRLNSDALAKHLPVLEDHLATYGLISLFTPPQKIFEEKAAEGFNARAGNEFMWAQCYMISASFARRTLDAAEFIDESKTGGFDENHYRFASQLYDLDMLTLIGSFATHNLNLKSSHGAPAAIGAVERQTRIMVDEDADYRVIRPFYARTKADLKRYMREGLPQAERL